MIDFHQHLTKISSGKTNSCWKIKYNGHYLRMGSGKESWNKKSAAKRALMLEFNVQFLAHAAGFSTVDEYYKSYCLHPITCKTAQNARFKKAQDELLKLVNFVELTV